MSLEATYYSEKSIAVHGETKPWSTDLKNIGGKYNPNLGGRPGWIFPKTKEQDLMQFIANANAGVLQPSPKIPYQPVTTPQYDMVPMTHAPPAMTPQAALARLQVAMPTPAPKPTVMLPIQQQQLNFPNLFVAADGLQYQIIVITVPLPRVGQAVTISVDGINAEYTVSSIDTTEVPYNSITLQGTDNIQTKAIIINGAWKLANMPGSHMITFHP